MSLKGFAYHPGLTWLESIMTMLILLGALLVGSALVIESETGKPAKIAIQEWWSGK